MPRVYNLHEGCRRIRATFRLHAQDLVVLPLTTSFAMGTLATLALPLDGNVRNHGLNGHKDICKAP